MPDDRRSKTNEDWVLEERIVVPARKGDQMDHESAVRRLGAFVRDRRKVVGYRSGQLLDVAIMQRIDDWYIGKTQYLEKKKSEWLTPDELLALADTLQVKPEYLLYVAGYLPTDPGMEIDGEEPAIDGEEDEHPATDSSNRSDARSFDMTRASW